MIKLSGGKSLNNRISFFTSHCCAAAIRNNQNEISIEYRYDASNTTFQSLTKLIKLFGIISLIKAFIILPLIENNVICKAYYLVPMFFYILLLIFSILAIRYSDKELLKNHGAEHMVASAYNKLKRIPTIDETKKFSRINKNCGISFFSSVIIANLIGFIIYICTDYIVPEILIFLVPFMFRSIFPFYLLGNLLQFFTTSKPDDENIHLAIAALTAVINKEEEYKEDEDKLLEIQKKLNALIEEMKKKNKK